MCVQVAFEDRVYGSPRELAAILPGGYVEDRRRTYPAGSEADPDACLCQVDLEATAERNGFDMEWSSPAKVILVFTRKAARGPTP